MTVLDPISDPRWRALAERDGLIFHHPAWLGLLRAEYGYEFQAVCLLDGDEVVAGLPIARVSSHLTGRRLVAVPFSDLCPPLARDAAARAALAQVVERQRQASGLPLVVHEAFGELPGATVAELYWLHTVDLHTEPRFASAARRGAEKARRAGVRIVRRTDRAALDAFYDLHVETRRRQGVPVQRRSFLRGFAPLFAEGLGFVALAELAGRTVAAAVFVGAGGTLTYKFGASDRSALDTRPNNLLFAEAIAWAREDGYAAFDLGRTDLGHDGLRRFKASWGAEERTLSYTFAGRAPQAPGGSRALAAVITRTPPIVGRAIGAALYRHVG